MKLIMKKTDVPLEDIDLWKSLLTDFIMVKKEQAYFPETRNEDGFSEDIRKLLIEHELGRRIAKMLRRALVTWRENIRDQARQHSQRTSSQISRIVCCLYLRSYRKGR
jgi:hemerythrin-like domain-containing protein